MQSPPKKVEKLREDSPHTGNKIQTPPPWPVRPCILPHSPAMVPSSLAGVLPVPPALRDPALWARPLSSPFPTAFMCLLLSCCGQLKGHLLREAFLTSVAKVPPPLFSTILFYFLHGNLSLSGLIICWPVVLVKILEKDRNNRMCMFVCVYI